MEEITFFWLYPPLCSKNISMWQKIIFLLSFNTEVGNGISKIYFTDLRRRESPLNGEDCNITLWPICEIVLFKQCFLIKFFFHSSLGAECTRTGIRTVQWFVVYIKENQGNSEYQHNKWVLIHYCYVILAGEFRIKFSWEILH